MKLKYWLVSILAAGVLAACGSSASEPSSIDLIVNGATIPGLQGAYCWDRGILGEICVDPMEPFFAPGSAIPANTPLQLQLGSPLPEKLNLTLTQEIFGDAVYTEDVAVNGSVAWAPSVPAGEYYLAANATWDQGEVTYRFFITLP